MKAIRVEGGYAVKRKTRVPHDCSDCWRIIESGEDYYRLTLQGFYSGWEISTLITLPLVNKGEGGIHYSKGNI